MLLWIKVIGSFAFILSVFMTDNINAQNVGLPLNPIQKQQVEQIVSDYLRTNPEIIIDAIETLRNREQQTQKALIKNNLLSSRQQLLNDKTSPVGGNPNGDVTIVEFFDYSCGFCKTFFNLIPTLLKQDTGVRYVFKELPILSPASEMAARAALVVWKHQKKKYFKFHSDLMKSQGSLSERQKRRRGRRMRALWRQAAVKRLKRRAWRL